MPKTARFILFVSFAVLYITLAPVLIIYSMGYSFDFKNWRLTATGGFYLETWPQEVDILVNGVQKNKTGFFSHQSLIQGLAPLEYILSAEKDGYYSWQKKLGVFDNQITRLANITLIKKEIAFEKIGEDIGAFTVSPSGSSLFLQNGQEKMIDNKLFSLNKNLDIVFWDEKNKNILFESENTYLLADYENEVILKDTEYVAHEDSPIFFSEGKIFDLKGGELYPANGIVFSPDNSKFLFWTDSEIYYAQSSNPTERILLHKLSQKIGSCFWLNNYYIIFNIGPSIKISEIDDRDIINIVSLDNFKGEIEMYFQNTDKKLYVLINKELFVSEPLTDKNNK